MKLNRFEDQLIEWNQLRSDNESSDLKQALADINYWWQMLPIDHHYLHWDDMANWPDPWELLSDGIFCNLAKAVGIIYTLQLINRPDINEITLAQTKEGDNLVLVNQGKYILNWSPEEMLNITSNKIQIDRTVSSSAFIKHIN